MSRDTISYAVGTIEYSIANEQVYVSYSSVSLLSFIGERKSLKVSL